MNTQEYRRIAETFYEAFNARDFERAAKLVADDAEILNVPTGQTLRGPEGYCAMDQGWLDAFPDGKIEVTSVAAGDDGIVAVEFIGRGTHDGPLAMPGGELAPTGRPVELHLCDVFRIVDGKVVSYRSYYDALSLLQQLEAPAVKRAA
jgi:steroid delta-isomerase-like uncharacterized protein